ncbi:MAG TPA: hypothetical protein VFS44_14365 [Gemmatimonadaceae bacterium]|nr:hypothetical protein [Gemmatimonadaceae bacterium]
MIPTLRLGAFVGAAAAIALACGDSRAAAPASSSSAASPAATARAGTTAVTRDSAELAAAAMTDRVEKLCMSDSTAAQARADAVRDSIRADSAFRADSIAAVAAADSAAADTSAAARKRRARRPKLKLPERPDPSAWHGVVAKRAMRTPVLPGALLPGCRVVAYYGNPLSKRMGILGEIQPDSMMARLDRQAAGYARADTATPVIPALELIAIVAQGGAGRDGMYRLRMSDSLIEKVARWAERKNYLLILDIQTGHSNVEKEIVPLLPYLRRPNVHLALDPEFAMPKGKVPGTVIGTLDAREVNVAVDSLAALVERYHLPPKMLIVHRFTRPMLTNYEHITLDPRVQVVIDMDGFGAPWLKRQSYRSYVRAFPVQFTGFKLFYKNDKPILTPEQVLQLEPIPLFIMYQ